MQYVVNPNRTVTHAGKTYKEKEQFDIEKKYGDFHERLGSCRKVDADIDNVPELATEPPTETTPTTIAEKSEEAVTEVIETPVAAVEEDEAALTDDELETLTNPDSPEETSESGV